MIILAQSGNNFREIVYPHRSLARKRKKQPNGVWPRRLAVKSIWQIYSAALYRKQRGNKGNSMSSEPIESVFAAGNRFENSNFSGDVWLNMLVPAGAILPVANVTFAPGCRNNWHAHQGGQVLLVTAGRGYY